MTLLESSKQTLVVEQRDIPYEDYIAWQTNRVEQRKRDEVPDTVSVVTFSDSVYTAPDGGVPRNIDLDEVILTARRGGGETWHGPGQIIVSPVARLSPDFLVRDLTDILEAPIRKVLGLYGVSPDPHTEGDFPGIQVEGRKIAQVGLFLDERVTSYGIAFNVTCDLTKFSAIDLCGIENCAVTNLSKESDRDVALTEVFDLLRSEVSDAFLYEDLVS